MSGRAGRSVAARSSEPAISTQGAKRRSKVCGSRNASRRSSLDFRAFLRRERRPDLEVGGGEQAPRLELRRRELAGDDERAFPVLRQRVDPRVARAAALETDGGAEEHRRLPAGGFLAQRLARQLARRQQALGGGRRSGLPARDLEIEQAGGEDQAGGGRVAFAAHAHREVGELRAGEAERPRLRRELALDGEPAAVMNQCNGGERQSHESEKEDEAAARGAGGQPRDPRSGWHLFGFVARPVVRRGSSGGHGREGQIMTHPGPAFRLRRCRACLRENPV